MTTVAEPETQETATQTPSQCITAILEKVLKKLIQERNEKWNKFAAAKRGEIEGLMQESSDLDQKAIDLESKLAAIARVAQYESDKALIEGRTEEAAAKLAEAESARNEPANLKRRQAKIEQEIERLQNEMRVEGQRLFADFYSSAQGVVGATESGLITLLGGFTDSFSTFERLTGNSARMTAQGNRPGHGSAAPH